MCCVCDVCVICVMCDADLEEDGAIVVKKGSVQGRPSHGMLCDSPSLRWVGGAKGIPAPISDIWPIGNIPPETKQRGESKK